MAQSDNPHSLGQFEVEDVLRFQHSRIVKNLYKRFLAIVENLERRHDESLDKLEDALPEAYKHYVALGDFWTENESFAIRKDILDNGNDAIRQLDEQLANYEISIKTGRGTISQ